MNPPFKHRQPIRNLCRWLFFAEKLMARITESLASYGQFRRTQARIKHLNPVGPRALHVPKNQQRAIEIEEYSFDLAWCSLPHPLPFASYKWIAQ
jgi:hypothetical protein